MTANTLPPNADQVEVVACVEKLQAERRLIEARLRASGQTVAIFSLSDTAKNDLLLAHEELSAHVARLKTPANQSAPSPALQNGNEMTLANMPAPRQAPQKLTATEKVLKAKGVASVAELAKAKK